MKLIIAVILAILGIIGNAMNTTPSECELEKDAGPCKGLFPRYFYNVTTEDCQLFTYGGCDGNENNFKEKKQCIEFCKPK
ncbi:Uncharacterised protein g1852 [Pycnogonum litorale]